MALPSSTIPFGPLSGAPSFPTWVEALRDDFYGGEEPRTLLELRICAIASEIRDSCDWWAGLSVKSLVSSWLDELYSQHSDKRSELPEDLAVFSNALSEVRWQASVYPGPTRPAAAYGTFSIDGIPMDVISKLLDGVKRIRATSRRDVRPGSDGLVVDLVDPSLYAYEHGVTPVLGDESVKKSPAWASFIGNGTARPEPGEPRHQSMASREGLAWLPSEFSVSDTGDKCVINSYINSLHPRKDKEMYDAVAEAFLIALPLFEDVLNFIGTGRKPWEMPLRFPNEVEWVSAGELGHVPHPPGEHPFQNDADFVRGRYDGKTLIMSEVPPNFTPPTLPPPVISLNGKDLQVVVKVTSIDLTPERPHYEGSIWQVEGLSNDRIVATTCIYLEVENVIDPRIKFRTAVRSPVPPDDYDLNDHLGVQRLVGLFHGDDLVQPRGTSRMLPRRALAWPNTVQHRMRRFGLHDETRPGRLTMLCFFLVDPNLRVRSTATVPPQMKDWIGVDRASSLVALPDEVRSLVASHVDGMSFEEACERRERLMSERGFPTEMKRVGCSERVSRYFERSFFILDDPLEN